MKWNQILGVLVLSALPVSAGDALSPKDAEDFSHHFTGEMIYSSDGVFQNGWSTVMDPDKRGMEGRTILKSSEGILNMVTKTGMNGSLDGTNSTDGTITWDEGVESYRDSFTVEMTFRMNDRDGSDNGFNFWMGHDQSTDVVAIYEDRLTIEQVGGEFVDIRADFTDGFHTVRLAHDGEVPTRAKPARFRPVHVWLDGKLLTRPTGMSVSRPFVNSRLIIGDTTRDSLGDNLDIDIASISYDVNGAFRPTPAPRLLVRPVEEFSHYFTGDMVYSNSGELLNGWQSCGEPTNGTMSLTTRGTVLKMVTSEGNNGWLEGSLATNGSVTWDEGVSGFADSYTVELGFRINDTDPSNNGFSLWMGHDEGRDIVTIYEDRITITKPGGGFVDVPADLTDRFHNLRVAHLGPRNKDPQVIAETLNVVHVWLDGVRLTHPKGNPLTHREDDSRLIIGDTTDAWWGDRLDIDFTHIAYDVDGAFAPIVTPPMADPVIRRAFKSQFLRSIKQNKLDSAWGTDGPKINRHPEE